MNKLDSSERIRKKSEYDGILAKGNKVVLREIVMIFNRQIAETDSSARTRLGMIVSKKHGNAVVRNRIKRLLREAFRLRSLELKNQGTKFDVVVIPRIGAKDLSLEQLKRALELGFAKIIGNLNRV